MEKKEVYQAHHKMMSVGESSTAMTTSWFCQEMLHAHNRLRQQHGAAFLTLSEELCEQAQLWADKLAKKGYIAFCEQQGIGENITFFPINISPEKVVEHWYSEHVKYEYETPGWQAGTNYFTQLVWKATEEIGIGRSIVWAESSTRNVGDENGEEEIIGEQVVVAFYRPAGNNNRTGQFAANVQKPKNILQQLNES